jgi:NADH:ubiquinone oxidoreductase subunit 6 (subunit J)
MTPEVMLFWLFAAAAVTAAIWIAAFARDWVSGCMAFVLLAISLSGMDLLLGATFVGVARLIVYAGSALTVLFAVVLIEEAKLPPPPPASRLRVGLKATAAATLAGLGIFVANRVIESPARPIRTPKPETLTPLVEPMLGVSLLTDHVLAVEALGLVVMTVGVIAVVFMRRRRPV